MPGFVGKSLLSQGMLPLLLLSFSFLCYNHEKPICLGCFNSSQPITPTKTMRFQLNVGSEVHCKMAFN